MCASFSSTFRKTYDRESLQSIKRRNSKYYWLSKLLCESLQGFGYRPKDDADIDDEVVYCGMSAILNMPNTNIFLRGPTSTSTHVGIAQNFTDNGEGVILELSGKYETRFDVSWISRYATSSQH